MSNPDTDIDWSKTTWEGSRREQLRRWRKLCLRDRLLAVEEMEDLSRRLGDMRAERRLRIPQETTEGSTANNPSQETGVRETGAPNIKRSSRKEITLYGCPPEPLMSYLKALGILRLVSEQADSSAKGFWKDGEFVLKTILGKEELFDFLLRSYAPTPIIGPWGARSGFYPGPSEKKAREALECILKQESDRLTPFQDTVRLVASLLKEYGFTQKAKDEDKMKLLHICRQRLPDGVIDWLDTCFVLTNVGRKFPPLLGTGGNEGSGSYVSGFAQMVVACVIERKHDISLKVALFGGAYKGVSSDQMPGHFSPAAAGGANSSQGMTGPLTTNPWDFLLCMEGACLWASGVVRRFGQSGRNMAAFPFTVNVSSIGKGTMVLHDSVKPKQAKREIAEIWLPLWSKPMRTTELKNLLSEGRATIGGRSAQSGVDLARAVAGLGVDRGISAFQRNAFLMRNGQSFLCIGIERMEVKSRSEEQLLREIDSWIDKFRSSCKVGQKGEAPPRLTGALRGIDNAVFDYCRYGGPTHFQAVLIALGRAERELMRDGQWAEKNGVRPLYGLSSNWIEASWDGSPEYELALALAGMRGTGKVGPFRGNLEPVQFGRRNNGDEIGMWAEKDRTVVWNQADLSHNLEAVLARRIQDAARHGDERLPLWSQYSVSLGAMAAFLAGQIDDARLEELLWGLTLVDHSVRVDAVLKGLVKDAPPLSRIYALAKPLFLPSPVVYRGQQWRYVQREEGGISIRPEPRILPLLRANRIDEVVEIAAYRLRGSGLVPMLTRWEQGVLPAGGQRLAAALLFPIDSNSLDRLLRLVVRENATVTQP